MDNMDIQGRLSLKSSRKGKNVSLAEELKDPAPWAAAGFFF
jgi:hypothetical protein